MNNSAVFRSFDFLLAAIGLLLLWPIFLVLYLIGLFDTGVPLLLQERVGRHGRPFILIKFRTMRLDTVQLPSHLVSDKSITPLGKFLRRTKLDELPQLWNVLWGEMSMVGPRPGLIIQEELSKARAAQGVYSARPGITGLAQINGIDMSTPGLLAEIDAQMLRELTLGRYFKIILLTIGGKGQRDGVKRI